MHGFINEQKAYFMNPQYPPTIIGGSGFYNYISELTQNLNKEDLLILDGGNFFQGNPLGISDSGKSIIEWMNMIGYDALVPGQYDFVFGVDNLNAVGKESVGKELFSQYQLKPSETLLIGDTEYDYRVAKHLGCSVILVSHGHIGHRRLLKVGVAVVSSVQEIAKYLSFNQ